MTTLRNRPLFLSRSLAGWKQVRLAPGFGCGQWELNAVAGNRVKLVSARGTGRLVSTGARIISQFWYDRLGRRFRTPAELAR
jgi:hypothetical protein